MHGAGLASSTSTDNDGITVYGTITSNAGGAILLDGTAGGAGSGSPGVYLAGTVESKAAIGGGTITILGTGANGITANRGINIDAGSVTTVSGAIGISGHGNSGADMNIGTWLQNGARVRSTGSGAIAISGDNIGIVTGLDNAGVRIQGGSTVSALGGATITITGTGASGASATGSFGVHITDAGSAITSAGGAISVTGTGSGNAGGGIGLALLNGASISGSGGASISLSGTSTASSFGFNNQGLLFIDGSVLSTGSGRISIAGASFEDAAAAIKLNGNNTIGGAAATGDILLLASAGFSPDIIASLGTTTLRTDGVVTINAGAGIFASAGAGYSVRGGAGVAAAGLRVLGGGLFDLGDAASKVTTIAGTLTNGSALVLRTGGAVTIGSLTSHDGTAVTTSNGLDVGAAGVVSLTADSIAQAQALNAGTLALGAMSGDLTLSNIQAGPNGVSISAGGSLFQGAGGPAITSTGPVILNAGSIGAPGARLMIDGPFSLTSAGSIFAGKVGNAQISSANLQVGVGGSLDFLTTGKLDVVGDFTLGGSVSLQAQGGTLTIGTGTSAALITGQNVSLTGGGMAVTNGSTVPGAVSGVQATGTLTVNTGSGGLDVTGGSVQGAVSKLVSAGSANITVGGQLRITGGSGQDAAAYIDPTSAGQSLSVSAAGGLVLQGGGGANAFAALAGNVNVDFTGTPSLDLRAGTGAGANAAIAAYGGQWVNLPAICVGCTPALPTNPLVFGGGGITGVLASGSYSGFIPVAPAPVAPPPAAPPELFTNQPKPEPVVGEPPKPKEKGEVVVDDGGC